MSSARHLDPRATTGPKAQLVREAQDLQKAVAEKALNSGTAPPPYQFVELIGKGSFGRVFKGKHNTSSDVVAIKIIDVDSTDYKTSAKLRDETIKDFMNETSVLLQLKNSKAKNINKIVDAFCVHSQLWIVSEYCPGGSLSTLLKATNRPGLEEKFIIPIARELAEALKCVHDAGIIHRDVKAANILVSEDGRLQLCDFGISAVVQSKLEKRSTIIGTPNWMPPEMLNGEPAVRAGYGNEVDCWAYGCTIYEIASGHPPNHGVRHPDELGKLLQKAPRLEGGNYTQGLRDFVAFCLEERPKDRPSMDNILKHYYVFNTQKRYPTNILKQLIENYYVWEQSGGLRQSLFAPSGAAALNFPESLNDEEDGWNFSTTAEFNQRFADMDQSEEQEFTSPLQEPEPVLQKPKTRREMASDKNFKHQNEQRVARGEAAMMRLFDEKAAPYEYVVRDELDDLGPQPVSDLPFRNHPTDFSSIQESQIDLGGFNSDSAGLGDINLDLANVPTLKANPANRFLKDLDNEEEEDEYAYLRDDQPRRATREWKFPTTLPEENLNRRTQDWKFPMMMQPPLSDMGPGDAVAGTDSMGDGLPLRPRLIHTATEPVGMGSDISFMHPGPAVSRPESPVRRSLIDLDLAEVPRPSTSSSAADSASTTLGDPFHLENKFASLDGGDMASSEPFPEPFDTALLEQGGPAPDVEIDTEATMVSGSGLGVGLSSTPASHAFETPHRSRQPSISSEESVSSTGSGTLRKYGTRKVGTMMGEHPFFEGGEEPASQRPTNGDINQDDSNPTDPTVWDNFEPNDNPAELHPGYCLRPPTRIGDPDFPLSEGLKSIPTNGIRAAGPATSVLPMTGSAGSSFNTDVATSASGGGVASSASSMAGSGFLGQSFGSNESADETADDEGEGLEDVIYGPNGERFVFPVVAPPSMEALLEGASNEQVATELTRLLTDFRAGLSITRELIQAHAAQREAKKRGNGGGEDGPGGIAE
ncbi:kinase-like protein [Xylona heveae TC161]|uniref:non-specific serine/threonine protein kinase n=1 Tax=Xylona heveae (strain CBS 132557 / TC161) TaxID=1328760 RepID=A0A165JBW0_XYLHT|nr:kinase-like protein [Xylona heveae TC161]KZF26027.1 kinase-like protein [Xylona heveae TC161]